MNIKIIDNNCCGCRACEQVCPKKCIEFEKDFEGFIYPNIDENKCIDCSLCLKTCPIYNYKNNELEPKVYVFKNKNENLKNSASGGACDAVARKIISEGGVVYGVAWDEDFNATYIRITSINDLIKIQSSKYVFADTNNSYSSIKQDLKDGLKVLFSGTSCQVDGLYHFLGKDYENLFTISIICHGVPSGELFKNYIKYKERKLNEKIIDYNFRSKEKNGWGLTEKITSIDSNGKLKIYFKDLFDTSYGYDFLKGYNYRENCYNCLYTNKNRIGDWSVGDYWGISKFHDIDTKDGVSVVCVMTNKGSKMLESLSSVSEIVESKFEYAAENQENLKHPTIKKDIRNKYYNAYTDEKFFDTRKPKKSLKRMIKKVLKILLPNKLIILLKKIFKH